MSPNLVLYKPVKVSPYFPEGLIGINVLKRVKLWAEVLTWRARPFTLLSSSAIVITIMSLVALSFIII